MTKQLTASQQIIEEVTSWPGIEASPGKRGADVGFTEQPWRSI